MKNILAFLKTNAVLCIAIVLAVITCFFVPIDGNYIKYFDFATLGCLLATLAVVSALSNVHFFEILARKIVVRFRNMRRIVFALVFVTYFGSMVMANDMALITFLPLGWFVLSRTEKKKYTAYVFILQNIAANLGGMLTPFGNPQNLYLYSYFAIDSLEFLKIMFPPFVVALLLIIMCCAFVRPEPAEIVDDIRYKTDKVKVPILLVLFVLSLTAVLRIFPWYIGVSIALIGTAIIDIKSYRHVNYGLILTFCAFFIFSGNMSRINAVHELIGGLLEKNTLIVSILSCQVISNVPTATLLCRFTGNYKSLLVGVNLGGLGTPVASLASLITLGEYRRRGGNTLRYLALFLAMNFGFLILLTILELIIA